MKNLMTSLTAATLVLACRVALAAAIYVSPNGNDKNSGAESSPLATLTRARDVMRAKRKAGELAGGPVAVKIRGGLYRITETLELTAEDSGTASAPVIWQAAPGEEVRLVGGAHLKDLRPVTDPAVLERLDPAARGKVLQADLKAAGIADFGKPTLIGGSRADLICNGQLMTLARYPNNGQWLTIAGIPQGGAKHSGVEGHSGIGEHYGRFTYEGDKPMRWKDTSDLWVHGYWVFDWRDEYQHVQKLDLEKKEIWPERPYHCYGYHKGQRFYFLNVLEELDCPGEWYLDRKAGILYFWPPCAPEKAEVFFPELQKPMVVLKGTQYVRVCGITFEFARDTADVLDGGAPN